MKYYYTWCSDYYNTSPYEKVRLKVPEKTIFLVMHTYYKYQADRNFNEIKLDIYTYANNKSQAVTNINESNDLLSFLYDIKIDNITDSLEQVNESEPSFTRIIKGNNLKQIYNVYDKLEQLDSKKRKNLINTLKCYVTALQFDYKQFYIESMLTRFRIFESIAYDYFESISSRKLHYEIPTLGLQTEIKNILDQYIKIPFREKDYESIGNELIHIAISKIHNEAFSKIVYMLEAFNVNYEILEVNNMVEMRNNMTHMKSSNYSTNDIIKSSTTAYKLTSELISKYFFGCSYKNIHLNSDIY